MEFLAATAAGAALFLILAYAVRARALSPSEARIRVLAAPQAVAVDTQHGSAFLRRMPQTPLGRLVSASKYFAQWQQDLERAGLTLRPYEYFLVRVALAVLTVFVVTLVGQSAVAFVVALPLGAILFMLPAYWVRFRIMRRIEAINKQLVETFTLIANGLRAGFAFAQSVDVAAKRVGPPMSVELGRLLLDINLGMSTEDALRQMNERIASDDVDMVVTAILIQRQSGGNLAEVLESVVETIRDRERIQGEIRTLTSSQRFTGWVLSVWPLCLALMFFAINPGIMSLMWETGAGRVLMAIWGALNVMGVFTIRRILDIDI